MRMSLPYLDSCIALLSTNNIWRTNIGNKEYELNASLERLFAYHIYISKDMYIISGTIRCQDKDVTPAEINQFVSDFKKTHPLEQLPFKWDNIKHCATDEFPLDIPNPYGYHVALEKWQEIRLLHLLRTARHPQNSIEQWFLDYVEKYALTPRYKRDLSTQHLELAATFCELHGINIDNIPEEAVEYSSKLEKVIAVFWKEVRGIVYILLYVTVAMLLVLWGDSIDNFWLGGIVSLIGFGMICVPLSNFFNKLKR